MHGKTRGDWILLGIFYLTVILFAVICAIPFLLALTSSFTDETALMQNGYRLLPTKISVLAYRMIFSTNNTVIVSYAVTIFNTVAGTFLSLLMTSSLSYPLSVKTLRYRNKISFYVYFTMLFNGGLVPSYILLTKYLHLQNTIWVYILPVMINAFNMFLLRNFFATIPDSLAESAKIDGANDVYILVRIILPLSKPALATIGLFYALGYWNEWFMALLYIDDPKLYTLQYLVMRLQRSVDFMSSSVFAQSKITSGVLLPSIGLRIATAMVTIGPIVLLYPFLQKYFIKGVMLGAIKG